MFILTSLQLEKSFQASTSLQRTLLTSWPRRSPWQRLAVCVWVQALLPRPGGVPTAISTACGRLGHGAMPVPRCCPSALCPWGSVPASAPCPVSLGPRTQPEYWLMCCDTERVCQHSPSRPPFFCLGPAWSLAGFRDNVSVSYCCCNKWLLIEWFKTTELYSLPEWLRW